MDRLGARATPSVMFFDRRLDAVMDVGPWTVQPDTIAAAYHPPPMLIHPQFDPVAVSLGPVQIHWYGLTYLVAFGLFLFLAARRAAMPQFAGLGWKRQDVEDLLFWGVLGVVVGGRVGYALFYKPGQYLANPLEILMVWKGGMSFHGGLIGVIAAMVLYARQRGRPFLQVMDLVAPCVPTGLASGRVGNFINGELWGRAADPSLPWAMVFPQSGSTIARHPSQVYQFLLEGLLLFVLLWWYGSKARPTGQVASAFMVGYGIFRFIAEYFREPDSFLGLLALGMSMGQWLCLPMIAVGAVVWVWAGRRAGAATA
jgi:phosphatidylglycerol:prolipoprotein diacylglycerol transferase